MKQIQPVLGFCTYNNQGEDIGVHGLAVNEVSTEGEDDETEQSLETSHYYNPRGCLLDVSPFTARYCGRCRIQRGSILDLGHLFKRTNVWILPWCLSRDPEDRAEEESPKDRELKGMGGRL